MSYFYTTIDINDPLPPGLALSYGSLKFAKFGMCAWKQNGRLLQPMWINFQKTIWIPPDGGPWTLKWWLFPPMTANVIPGIAIDQAIADTIINGVQSNIAKGLNMPPKLPI